MNKIFQNSQKFQNLTKGRIFSSWLNVGILTIALPFIALSLVNTSFTSQVFGESLKERKASCVNESKTRVLVVCKCPLTNQNGLATRLPDGNSMAIEGLVSKENVKELEDKLCQNPEPFIGVEKFAFLPKKQSLYRDPILIKQNEKNFQKLSKVNSDQLNRLIEALRFLTADKRCKSLKLSGLHIDEKTTEKNIPSPLNSGTFQLDHSLAVSADLSGTTAVIRILNKDQKEVALQWVFCSKKVSSENIFFGPSHCDNSLMHQALDQGLCSLDTHGLDPAGQTKGGSGSKKAE